MRVLFFLFILLNFIQLRGVEKAGKQRDEGSVRIIQLLSP